MLSQISDLKCYKNMTKTWYGYQFFANSRAKYTIKMVKLNPSAQEEHIGE